ncbi:MAG: glycosyltransferase family 39 protein [Anaerolineae bacterium]|nr:glycosyltransferase family 39 protein [Anaerolineae bacterium]
MRRDNQLPRYLALALLVIILVIAAGLRFYNLNWDNGIFAHPDERSTVAFYAPTIHWPKDISTLLDPRASTLNPFWDVQNQARRSYTYGHFPLYTLVFVANVFHDLAQHTDLLPFALPGPWKDFLNISLTTHGFARIGRGLMALADLGSVYLIFLLGRRLYGVWGGLLAAALSAFTVLQVQLAHFFAVDPISTTFVLLALYGASLLYHRPTVGAAVITGVGIGLAVASKFSALPVAIAPVVAGVLATRRHQAGDEVRLTNRMVGLAILALLVAFLIFAVTSPFVLLDFQNFKIAVLDEQGNMVSGVADFPFTRQYRHTWPYIYFIWQQLRWGMGWPLGLLAFAGLGWVILKAIRGRALPGEWIILWWIVLYFIPTGLFLAKFMRYMVPVVPLFTLFGAGLVVALWNYKDSFWRSEKFTRTLAVLLAAIGLGGAIFWTLAFVNGVYGTEHTWVTFARWVYANVPDGSCIAWEHWDDRMPTDIPEPGGNPGAHNYYQPQLPMYDDDSQQKYDLLRETLMNCNYVVLASNRLSRTIPGLPERYPMSTRYYQALFSGDLGFEQVYSVETPPRLFGFEFDDQTADESFTVYDHPKPILFQKTRQLTKEEWNAILGNTWQGAIPGYVGPPTLLSRLRQIGKTRPAPIGQPPNLPIESKSLLLETPVDQLPVVDDFRWNTLANRSTLAATLVWWLAVMLMGVVALPVTILLFPRLPDRGYALSKSFGLLLVGYFVWLNSSLGGLGNTRTTALLGIIILLGFSLWIAVKQRQLLHEFWCQQRWLILVTEVIFLLVFLFFVRLRMLNPDLWQPWQGGEKMLEIGFLNAIVKSATMPPYDPFFAGGVMNYYYYGMFLVGLLIKLTGIQPGIAFNLAVPMLAALTAMNVFSLAGNLANGRSTNYKLQIAVGKYMVAGLLGIGLVVFIGNLEGAAQFMRELANLSPNEFHSAIPGLETLVRAASGLPQVIGGVRFPAYNYWDPTRVIPETINEFPYFSFIFADLHPHMIGLPFTALFLSLVYHWLRPTNQSENETANKEPKNHQTDEPESRQLSTPANPATANSQFTLHNSQFVSFIFPPASLGSPLPSLLRWLALPFGLGAVAVINTWDLPTYLGLMVAAFLLNDYRRLEKPFRMQQVGWLLLRGGLFAGILFAATYLLYLPFFLNYQAIDVGLGLVRTQTPLNQHLKIWGFFLFIIITWLWVSLLYPHSRNSLLRFFSLTLRRWKVWPHLYEVYRQVVKHQTDTFWVGLWSFAGVLLISLGLFLLGYRVPTYLLPLVYLALLLLLRPEITTETTYLNLLTFTGLLILLGVEFFFLRDWLGGGDYYRMNTLFKFYIQVWLIFGVVTAATLPHLWQWTRRWSLVGQLAWQVAVLVLLFAALIYPLLGTRTRINDRFPGDHNRPPIGTLDGLAYMTVATFEWPAGSRIELKYDYDAIRWLQKNVTGTPIIAEAKVGYYREGGMRVAAYTGLPSILGGLHQNEQRYASQIGERDLKVNQFWNNPDPNRTLELMDELGISYVYVGQIERITHGNQVDDKFEQLANQGKLKVVFTNQKTKIYRREQ